MRPPVAGDATLHPGWRLGGLPIPRPALRTASLRTRLVALAVAVLALSLTAVGVFKWVESGPVPAAPRSAPGTAFLGTTTCADWRGASAHRRLVIVQMLGVAATQPDPESAGATLARGEAYALFQRVCASGAPDSTLLYESYNRAASFRSLSAGTPAIAGARAHP
jgi:hypothetical protein